MTFLKKGGSGRNKTYYILSTTNQITSGPRKKVKKPWVDPNKGCFSFWPPLLGRRKLAPKKSKTFSDICYIL